MSHQTEVEFPDDFERMLEHWITFEEPNVGWCLVCDNPIRDEDDLIPGTHMHRCMEPHLPEG
jgi:hypothetical protein